MGPKPAANALFCNGASVIRTPTEQTKYLARQQSSQQRKNNIHTTEGHRILHLSWRSISFASLRPNSSVSWMSLASFVLVKRNRNQQWQGNGCRKMNSVLYLHNNAGSGNSMKSSITSRKVADDNMRSKVVAVHEF